MSQQACFSSQSAGDQTELLMMDGDLDRSNAAQFDEALHDALHGDKAQVVIDLRGVSSVDSTMLSALVRGFGDAVARGGNLALIRPNPFVWRVFVLTDRSHSFPAFGRLDQALASFGPAS
jgi:anti-sigma B factor antagonist